MNMPNPLRAKKRSNYISSTLIALMLVLVSSALEAKPSVLKLATVAPKGSLYHRALQEMGEKWAAAQGKGSKFLIYTDGSQGSEASTVRRMRIGQIQAAMLTASGLFEIDESVSALQFMPLIFNDWNELDYARERIQSELEEKFRKKGFHILFWGEGGWVQFFSNAKRLSPDDFKKARIFTWEGTRKQVTILKSLGFNPVVLELGDIVPGVQTGMLDVVPVAPMWALAGQFYRNTPHMLRINWAPIVGATVITTKVWNAMSPEVQEAFTQAAKDAGKTLRDQRHKLDESAISAMQKRGLIVHEMTSENRKIWMDFMKPVWPEVRGQIVPADTFDKVQDAVNEYRMKK